MVSPTREFGSDVMLSNDNVVFIMSINLLIGITCNYGFFSLTFSLG